MRSNKQFWQTKFSYALRCFKALEKIFLSFPFSSRFREVISKYGEVVFSYVNLVSSKLDKYRWEVRILYFLLLGNLLAFGWWKAASVGLVQVFATAANTSVGGGGIIALAFQWVIGLQFAGSIGNVRISSALGSFVGVWEKREGLQSPIQKKRALIVILPCVLGAIGGTFLMQRLGDYGIRMLSPFLMGACLLTLREREPPPSEPGTVAANSFVFVRWGMLVVLCLASAWGAAIGGGMAIIYAAILLPMMPNESMRNRVIPLRQWVQFLYNFVAMIGYLWLGVFTLPELPIMIIGSAIGATLGNDFINKVSDKTLLWTMRIAVIVVTLSLIGKNWNEYRALLGVLLF